jgi:hypothetical protein
MMQLVLTLTLTLNGAGWSAAGGAALADAGPPAHQAHAGMLHMDGHDGSFPSGAGDCCDEETMDCECGCIVPHPAGCGVAAAVRGNATPLPPADYPRAHHPLNLRTPPFRPPA